MSFEGMSVSNQMLKSSIHPEPYPVNKIPKIKSINDHYQLGKELGKGYTATVFEAHSPKHTESLAIKVITKERQRLVARECYYRDIYNYLWCCPGPYMGPVIQVLEDEEHFYVITNRCQGPDLVQFVLDFPPGEVPVDIIKHVMCSLLTAVCHLHRHNVLHRDIKLDNIMLRKPFQKSTMHYSDVHIVLLDYDMAMFLNRSDPPKLSQTTGRVSVVGTREYMAPESHRGVYSRRSDLWSCGVILFLLLDGHFPFDVAGCEKGRDVRNILRQGIRTNTVAMKRYPMATDLCSRLLAFNVEDRMDSAESALRHPFLADFSTRYMSQLPPIVSVPNVTDIPSNSLPTMRLEDPHISPSFHPQAQIPRPLHYEAFQRAPQYDNYLPKNHLPEPQPQAPQHIKCDSQQQQRFDQYKPLHCDQYNNQYKASMGGDRYRSCDQFSGKGKGCEPYGVFNGHDSMPRKREAHEGATGNHDHLKRLTSDLSTQPSRYSTENQHLSHSGSSMSPTLTANDKKNSFLSSCHFNSSSSPTYLFSQPGPFQMHPFTGDADKNQKTVENNLMSTANGTWTTPAHFPSHDKLGVNGMREVVSENGNNVAFRVPRIITRPLGENLYHPTLVRTPAETQGQSHGVQWNMAQAISTASPPTSSMTPNVYSDLSGSVKFSPGNVTESQGYSFGNYVTKGKSDASEPSNGVVYGGEGNGGMTFQPRSQQQQHQLLNDYLMKGGFQQGFAGEEGVHQQGRGWSIFNQGGDSIRDRKTAYSYYSQNGVVGRNAAVERGAVAWQGQAGYSKRGYGNVNYGYQYPSNGVRYNGMMVDNEGRKVGCVYGGGYVDNRMGAGYMMGSVPTNGVPSQEK